MYLQSVTAHSSPRHTPAEGSLAESAYPRIRRCLQYRWRSDLTTLRERVSALRAGPLDRRLAETPRPRRSHHRALRRRLCDRIPRGIRCPSMSGGLEGTVYQVRLGTASGKDATDRIR